MTIHFLGNLGYHNETIVKPIIKELNRRHISHRWDYVGTNDGACVHIAEHTEKTIEYWDYLGGAAIGDGDIEDGDIIFILDFWNPIVFNLKFRLARAGFNNVKFYSIHHGSSHLPGDFASTKGYKSWVRGFESAWFSCYDGVFFGSPNAYDLCAKPYCGIITGLPIDHIQATLDEIMGSKGYIPRKEKQIIMPLRLDADKGVESFLKVVDNNPQYNFVTTGFESANDVEYRNNLKVYTKMSREELFKLMLASKYVLSCAYQETFGYGVLEAVKCGCIPVLRNSKTNCYADFYKSDYLFDDIESVQFDELKLNVKDYPLSATGLKYCGNDAAKTMVKVMLENE